MDQIIEPALHRQLAVELFNHVWTLLDKKERTPAEDEEMIHAAHASRYHWGVAGTAKEWSIGEWQIARVYAVLGHGEAAIRHGRRALELAQESRAGAFYIAYGHEAMARGYAMLGDAANARHSITMAREAAAGVGDAEERKMIEGDLAGIALA